jgi:hypothetical protein
MKPTDTKLACPPARLTCAVVSTSPTAPLFATKFLMTSCSQQGMQAGMQAGRHTEDVTRCRHDLASCQPDMLAAEQDQHANLS